MKNKRLMIILACIVGLLLIPLVAMQFTNEVQWDSFDFLVMGFLLLIVGFSFEMVWRFVKSFRNRFIICAIILIAFLLLWAELAVGIFDSPIAGS